MLRGSRYVPAERVAAIVEGQVELDLDADEFKHLEEHTRVAAERGIRADTTDLQ